MRHTIEDKRKMRNSRKKRKRHQQRELKRTAVIENALRDVRASADQQRTLASKYYKLWKSVDTNKKLQDVLNKSERQQKVMYKRFSKSSITHLYTQQYNILMYILLLFIQ